MKKFDPTSEQKSVIDFPNHMVITACPGSGKTAVITEKIKKLLPSLPAYRGVIAISYTRKASAELKRRCQYGAIDTKKSYFGTIDSFSISEIILPFLPHIVGKNSEHVEIKYLNQISEEQQTKFSAINDIEICSKDINKWISHIECLYKQGIVLMEFVGILAVHILKNSKACQRYLVSKYSGIFIDEYQDSGEAQHALFTLFKDLGIISVAVGDENQSIFGFSHRNPKYLISLRNTGSGYQHFTLSENHRCHRSIINYAERLLNPNSIVHPVDAIRVFRRTIEGTQEDIGKWIDAHVTKIKEIFSVEHNREIGILVRNSKTGLLIEQNIKVPSRFFNDNELSDSRTTSSLVLSALLNFRFDPKLTAQSIIDEFSARHLSREKLTLLRKKIIKCRSCSDAETILVLMDAAQRIIEEELSPESILALAAVLNDTQKMQHFFPISDNEVQILTLHKAKGLEFKIVFHLDLYDWILPKRIFVAGDYNEIFENEQECLNLHFVGITRAQEACVLIDSTKRINFNDDVKNANPSQFFAKPGLENLYA